VKEREQTFESTVERGADVGGAVEMGRGHGSVAHHQAMLRCVLRFLAPSATLTASRERYWSPGLRP